jgi:hypothetical protein
VYNNRHHEFITQYNHKLFAHINRWGSDVVEYIGRLKPKVIKFLDPNLDNIRLVRELVPDVLLIYRQWQPAQPLGNSEPEAFQLGVNFGQKIAAEEVVRRGLVNLVESYNEVLGETAPAAEHQKYALFQAGFREGLGDAPVEPVAFNFGTGNMTANLIMTYYGEVLDSYKWLGFHEYDWPTMDRLHNVGLHQGNGGQWLALRYRRIMEPIINQFGNNWSVIITECGMTQGVLGGLDVGFAHPTNTVRGEWSGYPTPISNNEYWETLGWYSDELMKDDYVAGACMFVAGGLSPWESFETLGTITPKLAEFQKEIDSGGNMEEPKLKVLKLVPGEYESYTPPFSAEIVRAAIEDEVFVDDLRDDDDDSLNLVPRITTFAQLKSIFKLDIDHSLGRDAASDGELYWAVVGFYLRTGVAAFIPKVLGENGQPLPPPGAFVFAHWPGAPVFPGEVNPPYHLNAVGGFTNINGDIGFGYSGGAVVGENGGPYDIWVSADPPGGTRFYSDAVVNAGWFGGTDHFTPSMIFQATVKNGTTPPPPSGQSELRVFDQDNQFVGRVMLSGGQGTGGRIALFNEGIEQSYVGLE